MGSTPTSPAVRLLLPAACLVVVVAGLKVAQELLIPLVFAGFLSILCAPIVEWLGRRRVPPMISIPLVVLGAMAILGSVGAFVGTSVNAFFERVPSYTERMQQVVASGSDWLAEYGVTLTTGELRDAIEPGALMKAFSDALSQLASILSNVLLVILTMVFILFEITAVPLKLRAAMGDPQADLSHLSRVTSEVKNYVVIKTYVSIGTGLTVWLVLWLAGIDFASLWGLIAFLLNYVPNIGSILAAIPPVLLALVQYGVGRALIVLAAFVGINMVVGNVIEPQLMGKRLGMSALVVFLSLVVWGWLWGPAGMLLSVPLTMVVKILLENSESGRRFAILLDAAPPQVAVKPPQSSG